MQIGRAQRHSSKQAGENSHHVSELKRCSPLQRSNFSVSKELFQHAFVSCHNVLSSDPFLPKAMISAGRKKPRLFAVARREAAVDLGACRSARASFSILLQQISIPFFSHRLATPNCPNVTDLAGAE